MQNEFFSIEPPSGDYLWSLRDKASGESLGIAAPVAEINGRLVRLNLERFQAVGEARTLPNGCTEYAVSGVCRGEPSLNLEIRFRMALGNPIVRFRYIVSGPENWKMTKSGGRDALSYLDVRFDGADEVREIRFSEFFELAHSFCLQEERVPSSFFENGLSLMGPMLAADNEKRAFLVAYEHGSQYPDAYLTFDLRPDRQAVLKAVKGNYPEGRSLQRPFESVWFQLGMAKDLAALAEGYRSFTLNHLAQSRESRKPYIFFNTWNYSERNKHWNGKTYLESMNQERVLAEIDVAHRLGVEVFVIDTGWYQKTGDWQVNLERFPDGLKAVREKLNGYGMKLGLSFNPIVAAVSSSMWKRHTDCVQSRQGKVVAPFPVWETEESQMLCLVSRYANAFTEELIRLVRELGVSYFKWDGVSQYGCDDPGHHHGGPENSTEERADCQAFEQVGAMCRIIDRLTEACPEAIVDFDITEGQRSVGLSFLSAGKYFLLNNGPYYDSFDLATPADGFTNVFVRPGRARGWICRQALDFDRWIPSTLFLTHYFPDDPAASQIVNIASLILGQNGIWGDLLNISPEGEQRIAGILAQYKKVRDDLTRAFPVRQGRIGGSPEIHEKIFSETGRGAVVFFANAPGRYEYVTANVVEKTYSSPTPGVTVSRDGEGRARISASFEEPGAKIIFFGA